MINKTHNACYINMMMNSSGLALIGGSHGNMDSSGLALLQPRNAAMEGLK